jgi:two-component system sensor histidine kinase YesM
MNKNKQAAQMLTSFMHMLRLPIATKNEWITIREELDNLENYINLMSYRYESVQIKLLVEDGLDDCLIPRLLLQPIVENSIFHGLKDDGSTLLIDVFVYSQDDDLTVKIRDNGLGMSREELATIWSANSNPGKTFNSIGLTNVRDRIHQVYGSPYNLTLTSTKGEGTEVELVIKKQHLGEDMI